MIVWKKDKIQSYKYTGFAVTEFESLIFHIDRKDGIWRLITPNNQIYEVKDPTGLRTLANNWLRGYLHEQRIAAKSRRKKLNS